MKKNILNVLIIVFLCSCNNINKNTIEFINNELNTSESITEFWIDNEDLTSITVINYDEIMGEWEYELDAPNGSIFRKVKYKLNGIQHKDYVLYYKDNKNEYIPVSLNSKDEEDIQKEIEAENKKLESMTTEQRIEYLENKQKNIEAEIKLINNNRKQYRKNNQW